MFYQELFRQLRALRFRRSTAMRGSMPEGCMSEDIQLSGCGHQLLPVPEHRCRVIRYRDPYQEAEQITLQAFFRMARRLSRSRPWTPEEGLTPHLQRSTSYPTLTRLSPHSRQREEYMLVVRGRQTSMETTSE